MGSLCRHLIFPYGRGPDGFWSQPWLLEIHLCDGLFTSVVNESNDLLPLPTTSQRCQMNKYQDVESRTAEDR